MNYRTISDLNQVILKRLYIIPRDIDLVVGIPRSGMFPANLMALYLNKPVTDLGSFINGHIYKAGERSRFFETRQYKKILIVDDSISSGSAMQKCKEQVKHLEHDFNIQYCVVYAIPGKENMVDYALDIVPQPRYFQWNILNHMILEKSCMDIDGVLCVDPKPEQNDDGEQYKDFILHAQPLFIPGARIGTLVTSRLEKYRKETEIWLEANKVKYNKLVMLNLPDKETRQKANCHASHKADEYKLNYYKLFIESSLSQAIEINRRTGKPVLCTENFEMIFNSQSVLYNIKNGQSLPFIRKGLLKLRNLIRKIQSN
ncbi:MAG: phosphoribosyl transferase [Parabacteroides sp.]|nr:phosphoribosyl transferase [Parabacteroides sp.]